MRRQGFYKKRPVKEVSVVENVSTNRIEVWFKFDKKIYNIVKSILGARFTIVRGKHWEFPLSKRNEIIQTFKNKRYYVHIYKTGEKEMNDVFNEPDVISKLGYCKKCRVYTFCGKDGLCSRCR